MDEKEELIEIDFSEGQRCIDCMQHLPLNKFGKMSKRSNGKNSRCFECQRTLSAIRRKKNKDKINERAREASKRKNEKIKQLKEEHQELTARDQEIKNNEEKMYRLVQRVKELEAENQYLKAVIEQKNCVVSLTV